MLNLVTHLGGATAQRELFDAGVLLERKKCFARHLQDSQAESHTVNLAADVLGDRACADVMDLKNYGPIWIVCEVPMELVKEALPCLVESKK